MRLRLLFLSLALFGGARASRASDTISVKISHFGLESIYVSPSEPTWVEVTAHNNTNQAVSFRLVASEVSLENDALPLSEVVTLPLEFAASETRAIDVPLHITQRNYAVVYVQALDGQGVPLGRTAIVVGELVQQGLVVGMLCTNPDVCRTIRQAILLSGSPEEQTHKSSSLRLIQLSKAPSEGWAYSPADVVILAMPTAQLLAAQRDALEVYLRRGGKLVLVEDQLADAAASADHTRFLDAYRSRAATSKGLRVGDGELVRLPSISSREFSDHFRPLGFTSNTPQEIRNVLRYTETIQATGEAAQLNSWLIRRLGTTFHFPSFLGLLGWIVSYLVLVGVVNFLVLRRIGRPDWGWVTIPALALLFSVLLYAVSARNHPRNFGLDEMTVYRLDNLSPMAMINSQVRISAPERSVVRPVLPGDLIEGIGRRPRFRFGGAQQFAFAGGSRTTGEIQLGTTWEAAIQLRRWSFHDLQFEGHRRFPGTVFRDATGHLHNETGLNFRQALAADQRDVFYLGEFPAGAIVDLAHVPHHPYEKETGRQTSNRITNFPPPPFRFKPAARDENSSWVFLSDEEYEKLVGQPFAISELIRGWPKEGDAVFSETKAVFFGLSTEGTLGAALRDRSPDRKAATLAVVTFEDWP